MVKPVLKTAATHWPRVIFDSCLSFKYHVTNLASKPWAAAAGRIMLANPVHGVKLLIMRKAVHVCIISNLPYGASAW